MKIPFFYIFVLLLIVQSCSSTRVFEKPDFTLQGKAQKKEYEKFKLMNARKRSGQFADESPFTSAKRKDLEPLMNEISPKAVEMLKQNDPKEDWIWVIGLAWIGTSFLGKDGKISPFYWVGAASFLGYSIYLNDKSSDVVDQYNRDLEKKFSPSLSYSFEY